MAPLAPRWILGKASAGAATRIDAFLEEVAEKHQAFSGAVLVAQGDEVLLNRGCGLADFAENVPNTSL
jgi:hypothetical protein